MTNNLDQFDQSPDFDDASEGGVDKQGLKSNLAQAWRTKPIFKLIALLVGVGALVVVVMNLTASKPENEISKVTQAPLLNEPPGGKSSPAFIDAQAQANAQRIKEAAAVNGTALPTPLPSGISVEARKEGDPLVEFRAEMKRQKEEQQRQIQSLQQQNQQQQQMSVQQDQQVQEKIGANLHTQMTQLAELWKPKAMQVIAGVEQKESRLTTASGSGVASNGGGGTTASGASIPFGSTAASALKQKVKPLIPAGTVNYAQILIEANSDVVGPTLAMMLSGPLSGARVLGKFAKVDDALILQFDLATLKGKEYKITAVAIDPDTTRLGLASEVDHRYFTRVILPMAASFIEAVGSKLSEKQTTTIITSGGAVVNSDQTKAGIKDGIYAGIGSAGKSLSGFFNSEAQQTKVLVRVAVGTTIGMYFTKAVCAGEFPCDAPIVPPVTAAAPTPATVASAPVAVATSAP